MNEDAPRVGSVKAELLVDYTTGDPIYEFNADKECWTSVSNG